MSALEDKIAELKKAKPKIIAGADKQEFSSGDELYEEFILSIAKNQLADEFVNGVKE